MAFMATVKKNLTSALREHDPESAEDGSISSKMWSPDRTYSIKNRNICQEHLAQ